MITLEQAVDAGCHHFLRAGTVDLTDLATTLAVSRATLYRVIGSRDALVAEVLWRLTEQALDQAAKRRTRDGIDGLLQVVRAFSRQLLATRSLRRFIAAEPETATRVLTSPDAGLNQRAIRATVALFAETGLTGRRSPLDAVPTLAAARIVDDPHRVAFLLVRIVESVCFAEQAGTRPDLDLTEQTIRAMLVRACTPRQSRLTSLLEAAFCLACTALPEFADSRLSLVFAAA